MSKIGVFAIGEKQIWILRGRKIFCYYVLFCIYSILYVLLEIVRCSSTDLVTWAEVVRLEW